jgi:hypothetical protein
MKIGGWRTRSVFERYAIEPPQPSRSADLSPILTKLYETAGRCIVSQTYDSRIDPEESRFAIDCKPGQQIPKRSITKSITRDVMAASGKKGRADSEISAARDSPFFTCDQAGATQDRHASTTNGEVYALSSATPPSSCCQAAAHRVRGGLRPAWTAECCAADAPYPLFFQKMGIFPV